MNKNFLFFITSFAFLKIVSSQDLETLCQTNNILNVVNAFKINPFENTDTKDVMNIKSLFDNFPDDFQTYAKPVLMFPSNEESLPKRAIVFYYGLKIG
jgi:hypothetical protein